jgi:hypothetical protein
MVKKSYNDGDAPVLGKLDIVGRTVKGITPVEPPSQVSGAML